MEAALATYTIYRLPADLPGTPFAVRQWLIGQWIAGVGTGHHVPQPGWLRAADDLNQARGLVPEHADYRMPRADEDDPSIVETWL